MATRLDKTAVTFPGLRLSTVLDPDGITLHYFLDVGYDVLTSQGETIHRDWRVELAGANRTAAANIFASVTTILKGKEGIP